MRALAIPRRTLVVLLVASAALALLQLSGLAFWQGLAINFAIFVILVQALNLASGFTGVFSLGHIGFIVMFAQRGFDRWSLSGVAIVGVATLLGTAAVPIVRGAAAKGLGVPVRAYLVVISSMCVLGWATGNWLIMLGATAFIVSDSVLGWDQFVAERRWMHPAIMITYHVAIVSLALSLAI